MTERDGVRSSSHSESTENDQITEGARVRILERSVSGDEAIDPSAGRLAQEYDVCYVVPAGAKGNDDPSGRAYLMLDEEGSYGGSHWAYPEHVEVVMTAAAKAARKPPAATEIRNGVASALMSMYGPVEIEEADYVDDNTVYLSGRTADDLRIQFRVRIDQIEEVD